MWKFDLFTTNIGCLLSLCIVIGHAKIRLDLLTDNKSYTLLFFHYFISKILRLSSRHQAESRTHLLGMLVVPLLMLAIPSLALGSVTYIGPAWSVDFKGQCRRWTFFDAVDAVDVDALGMFSSRPSKGPWS